MTNDQYSFLVNLGQAVSAVDKKARIHRILPVQPDKCQIAKIQHKQIANSEADAISICKAHGVDYKRCEYCFH